MVKKERIASAAMGTVLYCVAAVFFIGIFQGQFGIWDSASRPLISALGGVLISAYGLCSVLIPAFFLLAGTFCFGAKWSAKKTLILLVSIVPFFTLVVSERASRAIFAQGTSLLAFAKVATLVAIAMLLVALEYLLTIVIGSLIDSHLAKHEASPDAAPSEERPKAGNALSRIFASAKEKAARFATALKERVRIRRRGADPESAAEEDAMPDDWEGAPRPEQDEDFYDIDADGGANDGASWDEEDALYDAGAEDEAPDGEGSLARVFSAMEEDAKSNMPDTSAAQDAGGQGVLRLRLAAEGEAARPPAAPKRRRRAAYKVQTDLLSPYDEDKYWIIDEETEQASQNLKETLREFNIDAEVIGIRKGPVVTMFELLPAPGVKLSKIVALSDNIALRLAASSIRIVAPIPGKRAVGIEVPNKKRSIVSFRECIERAGSDWRKMALPVVLGKDIQGAIRIIDLVKTPHLLIAGATGAGKSVCVNSMILSILYNKHPSDVKLILIDPKIVELKLYNGIPHLLTPVITDAKRAMQALQYCLCEMEKRYNLLDSVGARDIAGYNERIAEQRIAAERLPYIVVIVDEFADLMATTGKALEGVVARLAAMSRAVGIHLVLATQRPSVDVITGLIKANIPSRIAFMVAGKMDSRIIIDQVGAEKLLGRGDMLYTSPANPVPERIQGAFVSDRDVERVVDAAKEWGEPEYVPDDEIFVDEDEDSGNDATFLGDDGEDPLFDKALDVVVQAGKASASYIQRRLSIGYNRAARLVEEMEERGIVGPANGSKPREILHMPS